MMALTPCDDATTIDWITKSTKVPSTDGTVARLVPAGYEAYVQVLHAIHLARGIETLRQVEFAGVVSEARAATDALLAKLGGGMPPGVTFSRSRHGGSRRGRPGKRVRWHELAELLLGHDLVAPVSFERDLWDAISGDWPDELDGPVEGSLTFEECQSIGLALEPFTHSEVTYWCGWANTKDYMGLCRRGSLADIAVLLELDEVIGSPEYWWPADRGWVVHTDIDLSYTLIGGSRPLIDALLTDSALECLELQAASRLWPAQK